MLLLVMVNRSVKQEWLHLKVSFWISVILWIGSSPVEVSPSVYIRHGVFLKCDLISDPTQQYSAPVIFSSAATKVFCAAKANGYGATMFGYDGSGTCSIYKEDSVYLHAPTMLAGRIPSQDSLEEVARGKNAFGTNGHNGNNPSQAVDGDPSIRYVASWSVAIPIWGVDLGEVREVHLVKIIANSWTFVNVEMRFGNNSDGISNPLFSTYPGPRPSATDELFCYSPGVTGRYLSFHRQTKYMEINEVEVYALKES